MTVAEARQEVLRLDSYQCVATRLDAMCGPCYDRWGKITSPFDPTGNRLEVDRITDEPMMGSDSERGDDGERIPAHLDVKRMVTLCPSHHRGTGPTHGHVWATAHRPELREYLRLRAEKHGR